MTTSFRWSEFHVQVTKTPDHGSVEVDDEVELPVPKLGYRGPDHFAYALTQDHQQYSAGTVSVMLPRQKIYH